MNQRESVAVGDKLAEAIIGSYQGAPIEDLKRIARAAFEEVRALGGSAEATVEGGADAQPVERVPFFKIGDGEANPGAEAVVPVYGGCLHPVDGFAIAGGCGNNQLEAIGVELGEHLKAHLGDAKNYFSKFEYVKDGKPEPYWRYFLGFFSVNPDALPTAVGSEAGAMTKPPIPIPHGTVLFRVRYRVKAGSNAQLRALYCGDRFFYRGRGWESVKEDATYTYSPKGYTNVECVSGVFTIK